MKAVILAGGFGTRLRPLTNNTPKPVVYVANRPFLVHQIELLVKHGIDEIILVLHFLPDEVRKVIGDGKEWGIKIHYLVEETPLGTAGAVKYAEKFFDKEPFVVFNGDVLTDLNISKLINYHREKKAAVTLTLTEVEDPTSFGLIITDKKGRVERFIEKPNWDAVVAKTINAGTYIIDPKVFKDVPAGKEYSFERQLYPSLLEAGVPIYGYVSDAYWLDIGNAEKYKEAHEAILRGDVLVKTKGERVGSSLIGEKVKIAKETELKDYVVLGDNVFVGEYSVLDRCIVWKNTKIGSHVHLEDCIIGNNCMIDDGVVIDRGLVLADGSVIKKGTKIKG